MARRLAVVAKPIANELDSAVSDYLASVKARGLSPRTVEHYAAVLEKILLPFLAAEGITAPADITQRVLDRFSARLLGEGGVRGQLSKHSAHSYLRAVGSFIRWAKVDGSITGNAKPQMPKLPQRVLVVMSREQIRQLEDAAATERDKLIVRILADTGLRLSELLGLTPDDMVEVGRERYLRVHGKGSKDRLVPVQPGLYTRLRRFSNGRSKDVTTDRIFVTLRRDPASGTYRPLTKRAMSKLMATLAAKVGITDRPTNVHALRHAFATHALRRGMNPVILQQVLGHADLTQITNTYAHLTASDASVAMMALLKDDD
jgi:integrase/recombinase XerD